MTLAEFSLQYDLHDSLLESVRQEGGSLRLEIDLCWWAQWWYSENLPETGRIFADFSEAKALLVEPGDGGPGQILGMVFREEENELRLDVLDDGGQNVYRVHIQAETVTVQAAEPVAQDSLFPEQIPEAVAFGDYPPGTKFALIHDEYRGRDPVEFQLLPGPRRPLVYPENLKRKEE